MGRRYDTVTFLTDYGLDDEFVGVVKCVLRDMAPHATVIDLTHGIPSFDVRAGALALARAIAYVPEGVVLAVVDPGVGTSRKAIAIEVAEGAGVVVGPDNGLLAPAVAQAGGATRAVVIDNPALMLPAPGATFAGRDLFAPAVAHLCNGGDLADLGSPIDPSALMPGVIPLPRDGADGELICEVLWVDRFGNVQLNVGPDDLDEAFGDGWGDRLRIVIDGDARSVPVVSAYGDIPPGGLGALADSSGMVSLALDRFSAAGELGVGVGDQITVAVDTSPGVSVVTAKVVLGPRRDNPNA